MDSSPVSPIEALNAAIQSQNPFSNAGIVKEQDVWSKGFRDVPTLNAHASDTVFQAIDLVRTSQSSQDKVTSIAITAQQGVGKTHVISRIRHRLECEGGALFVYAGVNNYTDLNLVKYQFQQTLADSLSHAGSQGVMQWQEVATAMANEGFKAINPNAPTLSPEELVNRFDKVSASWSAKNKNLMERLTNQVRKAKPNADPYIIQAILWTLSETQASFAIKWLSGEELAQSNAEALGLPNLSKTSQEREAEALKNIQQILNLVSYYNPVVICFDEIDVKNNSNDAGLSTELVIADLVKRLHDTLENSELGRGVVILTVMLPDTWRDKLKDMPGGTPDRVSKYTQRKPIDLRHIDSDSLVELVTLWLKEFYESKKLVPPLPVYPFEESKLREFGKGKPTVREALKWCAENFKFYEEPLPTDPLERFELALIRESEARKGNYLEDNLLIAKVIAFGFETLKGQTLEGVMIKEVTDIKPKLQNKGYIHFKVIGTQNGKEVKIGVAIHQPTKGKSLQACLERLTDYQKFDLTRGCLVRSKAKIARNSASYRLLERLTLELGGELVDLIEEQILPLIAICNVSQKSKDYKLSKKQVFDFISQKQLTFENLLLREILSDPSGQIDEDMIDDIQLLEDFLNPSSVEEAEDSDDLSDLFS
jgi:hypothetical protein